MPIRLLMKRPGQNVENNLAAGDRPVVLSPEHESRPICEPQFYLRAEARAKAGVGLS